MSVCIIKLIIFLQDPSSAIPKGTLLALLISMLSYALTVLLSGGGALRDASGNLTDLTLNPDGTPYNYSSLSQFCLDRETQQYNCTGGLHNSYSVSIVSK